jgi:PAS domain S-box-containing protein
MPLQARLLLLILIAVLPAFAILIYNQHELRTAREAETHEEALRHARAVDDELQRIVAGARDLLLTIAYSPAVRTANWPDCNKYLDELAGAYPAYNRLIIADRTGRIVCASFRFPPEQSMETRAHFQEALGSGKFTIGTFTVGRSSGEAILPFAEPFRGGTDEVAGVLISGLRLDWLANEVERKLLPPDGALVIADREGTILTRRPDHERWIGKKIGAPYRPFLEADEAGTADVIGIDGARRIYGFVPEHATSTGVNVAVGIGTAQALKPIALASDRGLVLVACAGLLALILAWFVADRFIRRPIRRLITATYELGSGTYSRASLPDGSGDWDALSRAFDAMTQKLASREAALRDSEARFQRLADATNEGVVVHDGERVVEVNAGITRLTGYEPNELIGCPVIELIAPEMRSQALANVRAEIETRYETVGLRKDGSTFPVELAGRAVAYEGRSMRIVVAHDLTAQRRGEAALRQAFERNVSLLREANHRIKNNLQLVSSLLGIQRNTLRDDEARLALQEARQRIQAIARVHEGFYQAGKFDRIDFGDSLRALCDSFPSGRQEQPQIILDVSKPCVIPASQATPLALIANELITNALKHAFAPGQPRSLAVRCAMHSDGTLVLSVTDNGHGLRPDFDMGRHGGFGLRLVQTLTRQVGGRFSIQQRDAGTTAEICIAPRAAATSSGSGDHLGGRSQQSNVELD